MRQIKKIIIHCTASDSPDYDYDAITDDHINERGWRDIGYHYLIEPNGSFKIGRTLKTIGSHCRGDNSDSIGISLMGWNKFNELQFITLAKLIKNLKSLLGPLPIYPHNRYNKNKTCPNFDVNKFIKEYL